MPSRIFRTTSEFSALGFANASPVLFSFKNTITSANSFIPRSGSASDALSDSTTSPLPGRISMRSAAALPFSLESRTLPPPSMRETSGFPPSLEADCAESESHDALKESASTLTFPEKSKKFFSPSVLIFMESADMAILSSLPSESVLKITARARPDLPDFAARDFLPLSISIVSPDISARLGMSFIWGLPERSAADSDGRILAPPARMSLFS